MDQFEEFIPGTQPEDTSEQTVPEPVEQPVAPAFEAFPYTAPVKEKKQNGAWKKVLCAVLAVCVVVASCMITAGAVNDKWEDRYETLEGRFEAEMESVTGQLTQELEALRNQVKDSQDLIPGTATGSTGSMTPGMVYRQNVDSVVQISCQIISSYYGQTTTGTSSGSGFVLTEDGYVVTNYHVVEGATSINVITSDEQSYPAELVGYDDTNDVSVLKIEAEGLQKAKLGSSDVLSVGDQVVAIGYPLSAQDATLTVGYVSAKNRDVTTSGVAINMLQTDAAINSGNSGGPLFNMKGEVIGITTAKYSGTTSSGASIEGIGFAIPIDDVTGIFSDLMTYGFVNSAYLGVYVRDMDSTEQAAAELYDFPIGVYVESVMEGGCALEAGVQAKDIIIDLGGYEIESMTDLTRALRKFQGGDKTTITVFRSGETVVLDIELDQKTADSGSEETVPTYPEKMPENGSFDEWYDYFFGNKD